MSFTLPTRDRQVSGTSDSSHGTGHNAKRRAERHDEKEAGETEDIGTSGSTETIIFPSAAHNFSRTLADIKRSTLSISNRLRSVAQDSDFVCAVADAYSFDYPDFVNGRVSTDQADPHADGIDRPASRKVQRTKRIYRLPLVANERCGSWYIPPARKGGSAYFKSTDGHMGQWGFSLRRLNLQILDIIGEHDGCIIVDSTRRGKRMPDALSKTVPIWCAVLNRVFFPNDPAARALHTPPQAVSPSEHAQIEARLDSCVQQFLGLHLDISSVRSKIRKPLRPLWITQDSSLPNFQDYNTDNLSESGDDDDTAQPTSTTVDPFPTFHPVILCTASRRVPGGEASEGGYVQGAGDDSEGWAKGLTAQLYWAHQAKLLGTPEEDLPALIQTLSPGDDQRGGDGGCGSVESEATLIEQTAKSNVQMYIGTLNSLRADWDYAIACTEETPANDAGHISSTDSTTRTTGATTGATTTATTDSSQHPISRKILPCGKGKLGSRHLRRILPDIQTFVEQIASAKDKSGSSSSEQPDTPVRVLIACPTAKDLSVGVALMVLCLFYDDNGSFRFKSPPHPSPSPSPSPSPTQAPTTTTTTTTTDTPVITKTYIRQRLSWIVTSRAEANPSRATLNSVNSYLFG